MGGLGAKAGDGRSLVTGAPWVRGQVRAASAGRGVPAGAGHTVRAACLCWNGEMSFGSGGGKLLEPVDDLWNTLS